MSRKKRLYKNFHTLTGVFFFLYKSWRACTLNKITPSFRTRRYFSQHSNRGNSLQDYPSFAGETFGTRIDRGISLIMSLRFVRQA